MTAGLGAAAYKAVRERRFVAWLRDLDVEEITTCAGAICIALIVFGVPIFAILNGTNALTALLG